MTQVTTLKAIITALTAAGHTYINPTTVGEFKKGVYSIRVRRATADEFLPDASGKGKIFNWLEDTCYQASEAKPFVLIGTRGEEWVVKPSVLQQTYRLLDGTPIDIGAIGEEPIGISTFDSEDATHYFAVRVDMPQQFEQAAWGDILHGNKPVNSKGDAVEHEEGDYLICSATRGDDGWKPNVDDRWIVNGAVFKDTYVLC